MTKCLCRPHAKTCLYCSLAKSSDRCDSISHACGILEIVLLLLEVNNYHENYPENSDRISLALYQVGGVSGLRVNVEGKVKIISICIAPIREMSLRH